ncbi:MAG: (d)CMP kinase [Nitrospirota bacterium]
MNIITIDGPVGAGKSTVARTLAKILGYAYLDTGAMYRAIGWKVYVTGIECNDENLERLCANTRLEVNLTNDIQRIIVDGKDITSEIRTPDMSRMSSVVSAYEPVRRYLAALQRETGLIWAKQHGGVVVEGRDMGTVVFPDAMYKFYLDADITERGKRRWKELIDKGMEVDLTETIKKIEERDANDMGRSIDPLKKADDAIVVNTTKLGLEEVVEKILEKIR